MTQTGSMEERQAQARARADLVNQKTNEFAGAFGTEVEEDTDALGEKLKIVEELNDETAYEVMMDLIERESEAKFQALMARYSSAITPQERKVISNQINQWRKLRLDHPWVFYQEKLTLLNSSTVTSQAQTHPSNYSVDVWLQESRRTQAINLKQIAWRILLDKTNRHESTLKLIA